MRAALSIAALALILALGPPGHAQALTRHTRIAPRSRHYTAETVYVTPPAGSPLAPLVHGTLAAWARESQRQFIEMVRQDDPPDAPRRPFYRAEPFRARYPAPRLFSLGMEEDQYESGAHPSTDRITFNFGLVRGRPRRLGLADFFVPGSGYHKQVQTLLLAKLRGDEAALDSSKMQALDPAQLNGFIVERDGLRFSFGSLEVSPYAGPPVEVTLTARELGPFFRRDLAR